jgi:hypothetical protein
MMIKCWIWVLRGSDAAHGAHTNTEMLISVIHAGDGRVQLARSSYRAAAGTVRSNVH